MRFLMIFAVAALLGCNEPENANADYVDSQKDKVMEVLEQNTKANNQPEKITVNPVDGNKLYSQGVVELRKVYANPEGGNCIALSEQVRGINKVGGYNTPDLGLSHSACKSYSEKTPYSFAEIIDPKAISHFRTESLRANCQKQEKNVDGRWVKRAKSCEQFFGSTK